MQHFQHAMRLTPNAFVGWEYLPETSREERTLPSKRNRLQSLQSPQRDLPRLLMATQNRSPSATIPITKTLPAPRLQTTTPYIGTTPSLAVSSASSNARNEWPYFSAAPTPANSSTRCKSHIGRTYFSAIPTLRTRASVAKHASAHSASAPQLHLQSQASIAKRASARPASAPRIQSGTQATVAKPTLAGPASLPHSAERSFAGSDDDAANRPQKKARHFRDIHRRSDESSDDTDYGPIVGLEEGLEEEEVMADGSFVGFPDDQDDQDMADRQDEDEESSTSGQVINRRKCPANFYFTNHLAPCPMEFESDEDAREHVQKFHTYIPPGPVFCECARNGHDKDDCCLENGCTWFFASNDEGFIDCGWTPGAIADMATTISQIHLSASSGCSNSLWSADLPGRH
jgi:hypothetical protein